MALTINGRNRILDRLLGNSSPTTVFVAVMSTAPLPNHVGANLTEPSGGSYARVSVPNDTNNWTGAANGVKENRFSIIFPTATNTWGNMRYWAICDAASGGDILVWGAMTSQNVLTGTTLRFPPDSIIITANQET